ncbi:DMT family transporter [Curvivirga sp.]|uniref:DMT family transporter n=1 Tax=Curvivirga sp. TaxID=2856848 RepID=UPI003B5CDD15
MDNTNRIEAFVLGIGFCLLWSSAFIAGKFSIISAPPLGFLMVRFFFATGLMLLVIRLFQAKREKTSLKFTWQEVWVGSLLGLLNNALYLGLCFIAFKTTDAGVVALIASAMPLVTAVLAKPVLGESFTLRKFIGLILGIFGVWYVLQGRVNLDGGLDPFGITITIIATICLGLGTITYRKWGTGQDTLNLNLFQMISSAVILLPISYVMEDWGVFRLDEYLIGSMAYSAVFISIGGLLMWFRLIKLIGAGAASSFHFLNPGFTLIMAWAILGEPIVGTDLLGLIPVVIGIILVTWTGLPKVKVLKTT